MNFPPLPFDLRTTLARIGPTRAAFIGSLLLTLIAVQTHLINRDGILYIDLARSVLDNGIGSLFSEKRWAYNWPFFPALIAAFAKLSGLHVELAAHTLDALLLAGTCTLIVAITQRAWPTAGWAACLVVLAMPAYNSYRHEILREYGFWFFSVLALWLAMQWHDSRRWKLALGCQLALVASALFRLEAVAFFPVLAMWQLYAAPPGARLRAALQIAGIPLALGALAALTLASGLFVSPDRVLYYLNAINPVSKVRLFEEAGRTLYESGALKYKYSREEAGYILFFGLLSVIPVKFVQMTGVLLIPLGYQLAIRSFRETLARLQPLGWVFVIYTLILAIFVTDQFFLVGRYVSFLNLLAVPVAAVGLSLLIERFPRWRYILVALVVLTALANTISTSPRKTNIVEAGRWLAANVQDPARVYVESARVTYYAGWQPPKDRVKGHPPSRVQIASMVAKGRYDLLVFEHKKNDAELDRWTTAHHLTVVRRFDGRAGHSVLVLAPEQPKKNSVDTTHDNDTHPSDHP